MNYWLVYLPQGAHNLEREPTPEIPRTALRRDRVRAEVRTNQSVGPGTGTGGRLGPGAVFQEKGAASAQAQNQERASRPTKENQVSLKLWSMEDGQGVELEKLMGAILGRA